MMCLTVKQPWASLFFLPADHPDWKGVENRCWRTSHRGLLLIHAGIDRKFAQEYCSRDLVRGEYSVQESDLAFGVILGQVNLLEVLDIEQGVDARRFHDPHFTDPDAVCRHPWLRCHKHIRGPKCWVFGAPRRFVEPIPFRGAQGLFNVPESDLEGARFE